MSCCYFLIRLLVPHQDLARKARRKVGHFLFALDLFMPTSPTALCRGELAREAPGKPPQFSARNSIPTQTEPLPRRTLLKLNDILAAVLRRLTPRNRLLPPLLTAAGFDRPYQSRRSNRQAIRRVRIRSWRRYGGCTRGTFVCAGFLDSRSVNPCTAATHTD